MKITPPAVMFLTPALVMAITLSGCTREAKKDRALESAIKYFEKADYPAAEIELKNAMDADPGNPKAIKYLGIIRRAQGASYEAAMILTQAKKKLPTDDEVGVNLAKSLYQIGYFPDCRKELFEVLDRSPSNGDALMLLAESSLTPEWIDQCDKRINAAGGKSPSRHLAGALLELRRGSIESGSAMVEEVLKSDPGLAIAHALKASILSSKKLPDEALAELKLAAECAGPRSNESIGYARMLMARDRRDEAVAYLEKLTSEYPDFLPAFATLGHIAYSNKEDEKAKTYFTKSLSKNPVDMTSAMLQAELLVRGKEPQKAVDLLEKTAIALPNRPQLELALAKCYISASKTIKATEVLDRLLAVTPEFTEAGRIRAGIYLQDGKTADAISILEAIRGRGHQDAASRDLLIRAYRMANRHDDAIALLREKADQGKDSGSQVELGKLLSSQGKLGEARSIFEGALEDFTDNLAAVSNLASIDLREGKGDAALKRVDDYITTHPDSSEAHTFKAGIALDLKKPELAEQSLNKAIELKPNNAAAYGLLLRVKGGPGKEAEALAILERYLKAYPKDPQALMNYGNALRQLNRPQESRAAFLALIAAAPNLAPAYNNLATLESEILQDLESAASHARKARSLSPETPAIADTLGWIEWRLGNYPAALSLLTEAAGKMPDSPEVLRHLGMARYSMGQAAEASAAFTKALGTGADFQGKAEVEARLAMLREGSASEEVLKKRIADNPKDVMSHLQLADLFALKDRHQEALEAYQKAFAANPAIPAALIGQVRLHSGPLNSPAKALELATKARELAPRDPKVLAALGSAKLLAGENEESYGLLKDAVAALENDVAVISDYARAAYNLGRIAEARTAMTRVAATESPATEAARRFILLTDPEALKKQDISTEVEKSLAKDPGKIPALMLRGQLEAASGKSPEATYLEILKIHPRFGPVRVSLANLYLENPEKLDQALSLAQEARTSMPDDPELTRILALGNYRKGDFKYAAQLLGELSRKRPLLPGELLALGLSLANSKQPEKARQPLDEALKAGLAEAEIVQAKAALSTLDKVQ
jgi:tetratricopeptide (TPR) repeat protein